MFSPLVVCEKGCERGLHSTQTFLVIEYAPCPAEAFQLPEAGEVSHCPSIALRELAEPFLASTPIPLKQGGLAHLSQFLLLFAGLLWSEHTEPHLLKHHPQLQVLPRLTEQEQTDEQHQGHCLQRLHFPMEQQRGKGW